MKIFLIYLPFAIVSNVPTPNLQCLPMLYISVSLIKQNLPKNQDLILPDSVIFQRSMIFLMVLLLNNRVITVTMLFLIISLLLLTIP